MQLFNPLFLVIGLAASESSAAPTPDSFQDVGVSDAVERELLYDRAVSSNDIDVSTSQGVVTVEGTVPSLLAKERTVRIAETVKGVKSVVDLVEVEPLVSRHDEAVRRDVVEALLDDPAADSYELDVSVTDGKVRLTGEVDSWAESQLAARVVKGVKGVTGIQNDVEIDFRSDRTDEEVRAEIEQALHWNHLVDDGLVDVTVADGRVTLTGTVGSTAEKRQARYDAWTTGVVSVDASGLEVARWARDEDLRTKKYVDRSDAQVREAVETALAQDPRVQSFDVECSVTAGTVTLRGVVDNLKAKRAADADADNTVGVISVDNFLKVRPADPPTDEDITNDVRGALLRDPYVERYETVVSVRDGVAELSGVVDTSYEKSRADDIASRIGGVVEVDNNLRVDEEQWYAYDPWVDPLRVHHYDWYTYDPLRTLDEDDAIEEDIQDEIFWSPFVNSDDVEVEVDDGVAILTGTVDSAMEKGAARDNAYEGGASHVRNQIRVEP